MTGSEQIPNYAEAADQPGFRSYVKDIGPLAADRYALTMTYAAWALGFVEKAVTTSNVFCRSLVNNGDTYKDTTNDETRPVKVPYLINAGLGLVGEWYSGWHYKLDDLRHLARQTVPDADNNLVRLFPDEFLFWLSKQRLTQDVRAIPEGQLIFPHEPSLQLTGLWWQQMLVEAMTLNLVSSSTNLATVASQVRLAAQREAHASGANLIEASAQLDKAGLAEMSLRRAMGIGGIQSTRAAYIAGWDSTSNDYTGKCYDVPVMGTFAHAWIMLHDTEEEAFENWAKVFPGATIFLVDTYDTVEGIKKAIKICKKHSLDLKGIRLDSGNIAYLSREAHALLKEAGYDKAKILATDSVSVRTASALYGQIDTLAQDRSSYVTTFGIGSEVAVNRSNPLHDFVMKLAARHPDIGAAKDTALRELIKLSENVKKTTIPGLTDVIRYIDAKGKWAGDTIIPHDLDIGSDRLSRDLYSEHMQSGNVKVFPAGAKFIRLHQEWMKNGQMLQPHYREQLAGAILKDSRAMCAEAIGRLDPDHLLLPPKLPHEYGVGLAVELSTKRRELIARINGQKSRARQLERFAVA